MTEALQRHIHVLAQRVAAAGGRALIVGGAVRDHVLQRPILDVDMEIFGLPSEKVEDIASHFGQLDRVGKKFAIIKLVTPDGTIDISIPREDVKTSSGHTGFSVALHPDASFVAAARRRDFTMNAMGLDPLTGELLDPYGGQHDLQQGILRVVDAQRFGEDPLRLFRAFQFAARFPVWPDSHTMSILRSMLDHVDELPPARRRQEWWRLFCLGERPSNALRLVKTVGYFTRFHPVIDRLSITPQSPNLHPEGDVWTHVLLVIDQAARLTAAMSQSERIVIMLSAFLHDVGKAVSTNVERGLIRSRHHGPVGAPIARDFLERAGFEEAVNGPVISLIRHHMAPLQLAHLLHRGDPLALGRLRFVANHLPPATVEQLAIVRRADAFGRGIGEPTNALEEPVAELFLQSMRKAGLADGPQPIITGELLQQRGWTPGPLFGQIQHAAELVGEHGGAPLVIQQTVMSANDPADALLRLRAMGPVLLPNSVSSGDTVPSAATTASPDTTAKTKPKQRLRSIATPSPSGDTVTKAHRPRSRATRSRR